MAETVAVVGASIAGLRAVEGLRKAGFTGEIVVFGDEPHMPYNRPPLSKQVLAGRMDPQLLGFRVAKIAHDVSWRLDSTVVAAELAARTITLADGSVVPWTGLVIATGLRPRRLALPGPDRGRYVLRTIGDNSALRERLRRGTRLVIVGAGFVGCEVAATATSLGARVTVVAPEAVPVQRPLGALVGAAVRRRHEADGVEFRLGTVPVEYGGTEHVESVVLADGATLAADVVVEAVGCVPNTEWLAGNDIDTSDGVLCDNRLRVAGRDDVVACGDVARFPNPLFDDVPRRVEHWTTASDTGKWAGGCLGRHLVSDDGDDSPFTPVPSFWSDQYDMRLQSFGALELGSNDVRVLEGDATGAEVAVGYHRDGRLVGVVLIGLTTRYGHYRSLVAMG